MLEDISVEFLQDPLTKEKIRKWLDDIGLVGKLKGYENPITLFGLVGDNPDTFLRALPAKEGGLVLWAHLRGVDKQRAQDKLSLAQQPENVHITFKFGKATFSFSCPLNDLTLANIRSAVMEKWNDFYRKEFHLEHNDVVVDDELLQKLMVPSLHTISFTVISDCWGFSDYKKEGEYLAIEKISLTENVDFPKANFDLEQWKDQIDHAVKDILNKIKLYGPITSTCEASVREHVSPVLSLSALIAGDIMMRADQKICGLRGNGPLDYLYLYKRFPIVITEVKDEDIDQGIAQNDAQLIASRQEYKFKLHEYIVDDEEIEKKSRKRKYLEIDLKDIPSFGIVSSGIYWIFQKFQEGANGTPNTISKSNPKLINLLDGGESQIREQMLEITRYIVWILTTQKESVDAHPKAKRVCNRI